MGESIDVRPWKAEIEDMEPGHTMRFNHTDCPAGEDTRRRLYLTRTESDTSVVIGYCHNCQGRAYYRNNSTYQHYRTFTGTTPYKGNTVCSATIEEPRGLVRDQGIWPTDAQAWAIRNRLDQQLTTKYDIAHDPSSNRVYLPRYNNYTTKTLNGYQLRLVTDKREPKYYTVRRDDDPGYSFIGPVGVAHGTTVVVEDLASGIHVHEATGMGVAINYGIKTNLQMLDSIKRAGQVVVWLDNDSPHVIGQGDSMCRTQRLLGSPNVTQIGQPYTDPKHYVWSEIHRILN
jgi:hypothetical protein